MTYIPKYVKKKKKHFKCIILITCTVESYNYNFLFIFQTSKNECQETRIN